MLFSPIAVTKTFNSGSLTRHHLPLALPTIRSAARGALIWRIAVQIAPQFAP